MSLKNKNDEVTIKGIVCTDVRKHQNCLSKEDTFSPPISTKGLMLLWMIDSMEGRGVAIYDIPGDFLQTYYDKGDIHIKMYGEMVNLLEDINPAYYKDFI